ncbi:MAG: hypothetical protein ACLP01_33175 [Solirubrobacteraceae bacterium]
MSSRVAVRMVAARREAGGISWALDVEGQSENYLTEEDVAAMPLLHRAVAWRALVQWGENAYLPGPVYTPCVVARLVSVGAQMP